MLKRLAGPHTGAKSLQTRAWTSRVRVRQTRDEKFLFILSNLGAWMSSETCLSLTVSYNQRHA